MSKAKRLIHNSFWLVVASGSALAVGAIYRPLLGRLLGPEDLGRYTFIQTYVNYFLVLACLGVRQVIVREIARAPEASQSWLASAYRIRMVTSFGALAACSLVALALHRDPSVTLGLLVLGLSIMPLAASDLLHGALVARQRSVYVALANVVGNALKLGVGAWALAAGYGLLGVLWVFVGTSTVTAAVSWIFVRLVATSTAVPIRGAASVGFIIREAWPFLVLDVATRLYAKSDILILYLMRGGLVTGLYSAAYVFIDVLMTIYTSCVMAAYPLIARLFADQERDRSNVGLTRVYERLHKHMLMMSLVAGALLMSVGGELVTWVFGPEYGGARPLCSVLAWVPAVDTSIVVSGYFLSAIYRQRLLAAIEVAMMTFTVVLTVWLVHHFGAFGAAIATLGAALLSAMVRHVYVRRHIGRPSHVNTWMKPLICAAVMMLIVLPVWHAAWFVRLGVLLFGYAATLVIVRPYDKEDWRLIRSVIGR